MLRRPRFFIAALLPLCLASAAQGQANLQAASKTHPQPEVTFAESVIASFPDTLGKGPASAGPEASLIEATDGNLWGTTASSGANGFGEVFKVTPAGVLTDVYDFNGASGAYPDATLLIGHDGNLYGTTTGSAGHNGTLFQITLAGVMTVLHSFTAQEFPEGTLVQDANGDFYGTTYDGGAHGLGEIFEYSSQGAFTDLWDCTATDCAHPASGLVQASDGYGYGTSTAGGTGSGTVYRFTIDTGLEVVHTFSGPDGSGMEGGLVEAADGSLWGQAPHGGAHGNGDLFKLTPNGSGGFTFADVFDFTEAAGGTGPLGGDLAIGGDGNFYGSTFSGANGDGSIFEFAPATATFTDLHEFTGTPDGASPTANVIEAADGTLWGGTAAGGSAGSGAVYKIAPSTPITPSITLTANPTTIMVGSSSLLTFAVNNAYSQTAQQCYSFANGSGFGAVPTSGTLEFTPPFAGVTNFAFTCGGNQTATVTVTVLAGISFTSVSHNFGSINLGQSLVYTLKVTNNSAAAITQTGVSLVGSSEFTRQTNCPASLAAAASCEIAFTFAPTTTGTVTASWSLTGTPQGTTFYPSNGGTLTATGVSAGSVTLATAGHNFGTVSIGTTTPYYGTTLTNGTNLPITVTYGSVSSPFLLSGDNCPATVAVGVTCNLQFEFAPTTTGITQQTYSISATQGGSPIAITSGGVVTTGIKLTGTGQ